MLLHLHRYHLGPSPTLCLSVRAEKRPHQHGAKQRYARLNQTVRRLLLRHEQYLATSDPTLTPGQIVVRACDRVCACVCTPVLKLQSISSANSTWPRRSACAVVSLHYASVLLNTAELISLYVFHLTGLQGH